MAAQLITVTEYARRRGCDEKAVRKAIAQGRITPFERDGKKLIDPAVADIQWTLNTRARVRPNAPAPEGAAAPAPGAGTQPPTAPAPREYDQHKSRQAAADAERSELEVGKLAGRLLDRGSAERGAFDAFRELRDAWFAANKTAARKVLGLTEVREIELALDDEARHSLAGWEQRLVARLQAAACMGLAV